MVFMPYLKIASKREQNQACLNYAEHERFQVPCLKNAIKRIVINPLNSDFWRGYLGLNRSSKSTGKNYIVWSSSFARVSIAVGFIAIL